MKALDENVIKILYTWGIPSAAFFLWVILTLVAVPALLSRIRKRAAKPEPYSEGILLPVLRMPLTLFFLAIGLSFFIDALPTLPSKIAKYPSALLIILFVLAAYLFLDRLMAEVLRRFGKKADFIASASGAIKTFFRALILGFAFLIILDRLKITITPFLASLGIGGLVVALALQDTLSNFFSGIYISIDKPIRIRDYVKLESGEGYVTHIGWRSTRFRMLSNNNLIIPNAKLLGNQITNFSLPDPEVSVVVQLGVSYQSDLEKVEKVTAEVAKEVLQETEGGVKDFEPFIRYNSFGDFSIKFSVFLRAKEFSNQFLIIHEFIKRLHRRYQSEGIEIPYPIQWVYTKSEESKEDVHDNREIREKVRRSSFPGPTA